MKRLSILMLIGFAGLLASCGSSVSSSTQAADNDVYSLVLAPAQFTLEEGDVGTVVATVYVSNNFGAAKALSPQPPVIYTSSDPRVTVSPTGVVCAGLWTNNYQTCSVTSTLPAGLPAGFVTITAYNATHNVSDTAQVSVHVHVASITLSAPSWATVSAPSGTCVSQNNQVQYIATAFDSSNPPNQIPRCSVNLTGGCINDNDYVWTTDNTSVATVTSYGFVASRNPGVANVYANLSGTVSTLGFVTCPPQSIVLSNSTYTGASPAPPYSTYELGPLQIGNRQYVTASMKDTNGNPLVTSPLTYISSDPLIGSFSNPLELSYPNNPGANPTNVTEATATLAASTSGGFNFLASCQPSTCNPAVGQFTSPAGSFIGSQVGFGNQIYSNVIGATVQGVTGSTVLVTGTTFPDGVTPSHRLLVYDSDSMALLQTLSMPNMPNSLVVAPNGTTAYAGSCEGLVVVNLATYKTTLQAYPIVGGISTNVVTGTVLGVSPDNRYVLISDNSCPSNPANPASAPNHLVYLIDTTGTKAATLYTFPYIDSVTFAPDDSDFWIGANPPAGDTTDYAGVYVYQGTTFVPTQHNVSSHVTALAWTPDGQSYFASGDQMTNYSTCNDQNPQAATLTSSVTGALFTTALNGTTTAEGVVPRVLGLDGSQWFDYSVTSSSAVSLQSVTPSISSLAAGGTGNVCLSTVTVGTPAQATSTLQCTAEQISFSPALQQAFVTGVNPACATAESVIHGYDVASNNEIIIPTAAPDVPLSGGILDDGRKLYFGTWDSAAQTATLHRIELSTGTGTPVTPTEDDSVSLTVVPSFVAVVPK